MKHKLRCPQCKHVATYALPDPPRTDWGETIQFCALMGGMVLLFAGPFVAIAIWGTP